MINFREYKDVTKAFEIFAYIGYVSAKNIETLKSAAPVGTTITVIREFRTDEKDTSEQTGINGSVMEQYVISGYYEDRPGIFGAFITTANDARTSLKEIYGRIEANTKRMADAKRYGRVLPGTMHIVVGMPRLYWNDKKGAWHLSEEEWFESEEKFNASER